jgi:hypothetical protein
MVAEVGKGNGPNATNLVYHYVLVRYQTNAAFCREAPDLAGLYGTNTFRGCWLAGRYGDYYWDLKPDGLTLETTMIAEESMRLTLQNALASASYALELGLFYSTPGRVVWEGDSIRPFTNAYGLQMQGELAGEGGQGLKLTVDDAGKRYLFEAAYEFANDKSVPEFIPNRITGWAIRNGERRISFTVRMVSVRILDHLLPEIDFVPDPYTAHVVHLITLGRNGAVGANLRTGQASSMDVESPAPPKQ